MRRFISLLLATLLVCCVVGCGEKDKGTKTEQSQSEQTQTSKSETVNSGFIGDDYETEKMLSDNAQLYMFVGFLKENVTRGAIQTHTNMELEEEIYIDSNSDIYPYSKTVVLKTESEYENTFENASLEIDFEKEMLVLYFFTDYSAQFKCDIDSVVIGDEKVSITIWHELPEPEFEGGPISPCGSSPTHRCLAIRVNKVKYETVEIEMYESPLSERRI